MILDDFVMPHSTIAAFFLQYFRPRVGVPIASEKTVGP